MKNLKKTLLFVLCISMLVSCTLAGCKSTEEPIDTSNTAETSDTSATTDAPDIPEEDKTLIIYPEFDKRIERDYMYSVSVTQGAESASLPVYNHTEASRTTRNPEDTTADEYRRFSTFAFDTAGGGVRVDIKVNRDFNSYSVIPSAKNFKNEFNAETGVISVYLDKPDYFMIRLDNKDSSLISVFADAPETDIPKKTSKTIIVDGWHEERDGVLELNADDMTVYIKPGAVLNARIKITGDNCKVIGRGIILDPFSDIYNYDEKDERGYVLLFVSNADNAVIDGVHLINARCYNLEVQGAWGRSYADNARITNVKALSTQMSSDGFMLNYWIKNAVAEHCFIYCGDNALNYEDDAHFKDILVGTTCNAIFPQTDVKNSSLEDIYVFRADDNVINTEYAGSNNKTTIDNHTIINLYANDITNTTMFLYVENTESAPCTSLNGGTTIKNVYLPRLYNIGSKFYYNVATGNHEINLQNVSIDGQLIPSITTNPNGTRYTGYALTSPNNWGWISYPESHKFSYSTTSDFNANIVQHKQIVNYKNQANVFVGAYQVYYQNPIICEGGDVFVPFEQTQAELRTSQAAATVEKNGISYISVNSLVSSGMAKALTADGNNYVITPNANNGNLLLPDTGLVSQFTEIRASHMEIVAVKEGNDTVYYITGNAENKSDVIGIHCLINEAVKKYGAGNYRLTFDAKASKAVSIKAAVGYSSEKVVLKESSYYLNTAWSECVLEFSVDTSVVNQAQIRITVTGEWGTVPDFSLKNISLVKVS